MVAVAGQDAVPGKAERAGAGGEPPRPRGVEAGGGSCKLSTHPTSEVVRSSGRVGGLRAHGGHERVRVSPGEVPAERREVDDAARSSFPSVRNPCERAGVSRFSAAALAPPLNKID